MGIVTTDDKNYTEIADKIREKTGTDTVYTPSEMPSGIEEVYEKGKEDLWASFIDVSKVGM